MTAGIRVLGPLEAEVEGARADLGGRRPGTRCGCRTKPWTPGGFESLLTAARKDASGLPERARQELEQALALWRGRAG